MCIETIIWRLRQNARRYSLPRYLTTVTFYTVFSDTCIPRNFCLVQLLMAFMRKTVAVHNRPLSNYLATWKPGDRKRNEKETPDLLHVINAVTTLGQDKWILCIALLASGTFEQQFMSNITLNDIYSHSPYTPCPSMFCTQRGTRH